MGIVCELYRASDKLIAEIASHPQGATNFVNENFANVEGDLPGDGTESSMDKGWDVAFFLLKEADPSPNKVLSGWRGKAFDESNYDTPYYLTSNQVKAMAPVLAALNHQDIKNAYNLEKMETEEVYRAGSYILNQWDYFIAHTNEIIDIFKKAAENNEGIIINYS
ncbi:YfbM family protein [Flavobacterium sp. MFBS3-15]|uniref:YfbM family protein n=1 Tax=Flavobacterium sp. MFBS3-15 TaxID=2989816 RepID=UPI002235B002|nr:YfbM family protein [Flavobacterium sp. MFBS3-15]MCW4470394.1 YfbM family protein [Flavobacterium sp. MFBS3-15]